MLNLCTEMMHFITSKKNKGYFFNVVIVGWARQKCVALSVCWSNPRWPSRISTLFWRLYYWRGQKSLHPLHQRADISHAPIFHTPPFASISRLLSSRAFWSIDSSPWRLSSSCQATRTHGGLLAVKASAKLHILSHHSIFMAGISNPSSQIVLFPMRPRTNQKTVQPNREHLNQSWFKEIYYAGTMTEKTKTGSGTGREKI